MSYLGNGTFVINTAGQPVVTNTIIDPTVFNTLTADLATGLSTAICKDGQTTCTQQIPFALGISVPGSGSVSLNCPFTSTYDGDSVFPFLKCSGDSGASGYFKSTGFGNTGTFDNGGINTNNGSGFNVVCVSGGVTLSSGATSWSAISDERKKTAFKPFTNALSKVASIRTGTGRYLTDQENISRSFLSAQSLQKVLPEAVGEQKGDLIASYTAVIPLLIAALREALVRIEALEAK